MILTFIITSVFSYIGVFMYGFRTGTNKEQIKQLQITNKIVYDVKKRNEKRRSDSNDIITKRMQNYLRK